VAETTRDYPAAETTGEKASKESGSTHGELDRSFTFFVRAAVEGGSS
jgi:hypothetical protein